MSAIKFGIWGFGRMGEQHGKFYAKENDKFKLAAVCDTDLKRLEYAGGEYQARAYSDADKFLSDPELELIVIVTLSLDHTRHALLALEKGKYVLLDKPIAITDEELEILKEADKKYPGRLFVLHNLRFEPGFESVMDFLKSGLLGDINMIKLRRHHNGHFFRSDWQTLLEHGGGLLSNWGSHEIDHAVQLLGSHPADVWSQLWHVSAGGNGDDHVKILLKTGSGRLADIEISYNVLMPEAYCTVYGQRGTLVCPSSARKELKVKYIDTSFKMPEIKVETKSAAYHNSFEREIPWIEKEIKNDGAGDLWEYIDRKLIRHLYDTLRNGVPFPIKNSDAFETLRIIQEVKRQNPQFNWIK